MTHGSTVALPQSLLWVGVTLGYMPHLVSTSSHVPGEWETHLRLLAHLDEVVCD